VQSVLLLHDKCLSVKSLCSLKTANAATGSMLSL
jgi:hypothetical protein